MLTGSNKLQIPDKCHIQNEEFLYLSHVQEMKEKNEIKYRTNFLHNDLILNQTEYDIVLSNAEELNNNVKLVVLGRNVCFKDSIAEPYQKDTLRKSLLGKQKRDEYEKSDPGKEKRQKYNKSDLRKESIVKYEGSEHGKLKRHEYHISDIKKYILHYPNMQIPHFSLVRH